MAKIEGGVNLKRGTATKIARRRKISANHVRLVAKGEREGSDGLVAAILRAHEREIAEQASSGAPEPQVSQYAA